MSPRVQTCASCALDAFWFRRPKWSVTRRRTVPLSEAAQRRRERVIAFERSRQCACAMCIAATAHPWRVAEMDALKADLQQRFAALPELADL